MIALLPVGLVVIGILCVLAYRVAIYVLPMMISYEIAFVTCKTEV